MNKAKLLLVNLQNPGDTKYANPKTIGSYLLGRRLSNYALFVVKDGNFNQIVLTSAACHDIQNQIDKVINQQQEKTDNCTPYGTVQDTELIQRAMRYWEDTP